jgi:cyclase
MNRIIPVVLLVLCSMPRFLHSQEAQPEITLVPVAGPVYMLQGNGGNIGVIADPAGALLIDSMYESCARQIRAAIAPLPGGGKIRFLINTHWHSDHTDGNKDLGRQAAIIAHENVRPLLAENQSLTGQQTPALPAYALPAVTFSDQLKLYIGGAEVRLVHFPNAHTDGDAAVFIDPYKVVHMGDMFFNGMFPFLDLANGGDLENWIRQLDKVLSELPPDVKIIPGHGPIAGIAELKAFRRMLSDSTEIVRTRMKEGQTLEQIKAAGLPGRFAPWTKGFFTAPQWLELVYGSLGKK